MNALIDRSFFSKKFTPKKSIGSYADKIAHLSKIYTSISETLNHLPEANQKRLYLATFTGALTTITVTPFIAALPGFGVFLAGSSVISSVVTCGALVADNLQSKRDVEDMKKILMVLNTSPLSGWGALWHLTGDDLFFAAISTSANGFISVDSPERNDKKPNAVIAAIDYIAFYHGTTHEVILGKLKDIQQGRKASFAITESSPASHISEQIYLEPETVESTEITFNDGIYSLTDFDKNVLTLIKDRVNDRMSFESIRKHRRWDKDLKTETKLTKANLETTLQLLIKHQLIEGNINIGYTALIQ